MAVPTNSVAPYIAYGGFVGRTQAINVGTWTGLPTSYTYQWGRADTAGGVGAADIAGETASTYAFRAADQGKYVYCDVIASNADGPSAETRSNYQFCYTRVSLPAATALTATLDDLSGYHGKFIITETVSDSVSEAVDDPVTWKNEAPQNGKYYGWFTVAVNTGGGARYNDSGCTKISENWGVVANHVPGDGTGYYFLNVAGDTEIVVGYDDVVQLGDTGLSDDDLRLIHFDNPVSDEETPPIALPTPALYNALSGQYALAIERDRHLNRVLLSTIGAANQDTIWTFPTADILESGDSGKPVFVYVNGTPVLVATAAYTSVSGPNPAHWLNEINDVVSSTGDTLTLARFATPVASRKYSSLSMSIGLGL